HFGRPVPLRLVVDDAAPALAPAGTAPEPEPAPDPADFDLDDLQGAAGPVQSAADRLKEMFPGATEVVEP
ncbi:MAG: hypothetical protein ACRD0F_06440, partial [Acidimicrobiales bacterium]